MALVKNSITTELTQIMKRELVLTIFLTALTYFPFLQFFFFNQVFGCRVKSLVVRKQISLNFLFLPLFSTATLVPLSDDQHYVLSIPLLY